MNVDNWRVKRDPSELPAREQTPNRFLQQRQRNGTDSNSPFEQRQSFGRSPATPRADTFRKPLDNQKAEKAIEEGRRLYVGNMPYEATVKDVESLFKDVADGIEINMTVDPMTGRNPSYCFVDFPNKELAQRVMEEYNGRDFLRRPLKVKPGIKSGAGSGRYHVRPENRLPDEEERPGFDRWRRGETTERLGNSGQESRRLYVGGLPNFEGQEAIQKSVEELFKGFEVKVVSKLFSPREERKDEEGNHCFCFVELENEAQKNAAIEQLDWKEMFGWKVRVKPALGNHKQAPRHGTRGWGPN